MAFGARRIGGQIGRAMMRAAEESQRKKRDRQARRRGDGEPEEQREPGQRSPDDRA